MATFNTTWVKRKINNVLTKTFAIAHIKSTYYDYSKGKTLDDVLIETEDFDQTAVQESEIPPVILSKINAVATQTSNNFTLLNENKAESTDVYSREEVDNLISVLDGTIDEEKNTIDGLKSDLNNLKISDVACGKNLFNTPLRNTVVNGGVTCTYNGDGTYTLNGTASNTIVFILSKSKDACSFEIGKEYKLVGCPIGGKNNSTYILNLQGLALDERNGGIFTCTNIPSDSNNFYIAVFKGCTCDNVVFKPMITTDISATYDDFEPYIPSVKKISEETEKLKNTATQSASGLMSSADKTKLDGIATGANNYSHPTTSGNKHIPSGGAAGQILKWLSDGTAGWGDEKSYTAGEGLKLVNNAFKINMPRVNKSCNKALERETVTFEEYIQGDTFNLPSNHYYHIITMTGNDSKYATQIALGMTTNSIYYRRCDNNNWGNWVLLNKSNATQSESGLMSASDKTKLDGIATGANKTTSTDIQNAMKADNVQVGTTYTFSDNEIKSSTGVHLNANDGKNGVYAEGTGLYAVNGDNSSYVPVYGSAFTQLSSNRYKKNVQNMTDEDARKILSLRAVKYDYIEEKNGTNCYGFIAEEVNQLMRYPVIFNEKGITEGLDYSKFVPYIIKLLQMQQKEIDDLKKKIIS